MKALRKPVYFTCGDYTVSLGTGRKEFNPKKERPGLEHYIAEAGKGALAQIPDATAVDEGVVGNFMAARFNRQGHLGAMLSLVHPTLEYKPSTRVEGACCSGGLSLASAIKSVLSEQSDVVLALGLEVQNTVKAIYGADILAGAGHFAGERKNGHAYFFPAKFSDRAGAYEERYGAEKTWAAMGRWYEQAIVNARKNPKALPWKSLLPVLVMMERAPAAEPPISVSKRLAMTRNSPMASWLNRARASPSVGSVKSTPSTRIVAWLALPPAPITGWLVMNR